MDSRKVLRPFSTDIAVLRGMAILFVLGYHLFPGKLPWGFVGVDIFFIISGYLIAQILDEKSDRTILWTYYSNRFRRIYPALLVVLVLSVWFGYIFLLDDELYVLLSSTAFSLVQLQNFYEMSRAGYFVDAVNFRPFLHLWSLGVEFQFYIAFPLFLIWGRRAGLSNATVTRSVTLISIGMCLVLGSILGSDIFFLPLTRIWELSLGASCYQLTAGGWRARGATRATLLLCSVLGAAGVVLIVRPGSIYPDYTALLPTITACSFILARPTHELNKSLMRPIIFAAAISYSLYLWHYPIIEFARQTYGPLTVSQRFLILAVSFFGAYLTDIHLVPRILRIRRATLFLLVCSLVAFGSILILNPSLSNVDRPIKLRNVDLIKNNNFKIDYKFDCQFLTGKANIEDRCRTGSNDGAKPLYVILGDSHANALTTVFDALAVVRPEFSRYVQIGRGLCPLVPDVGDAECQALTDIAIAFATEPTSPKYVVLAGQWPLYINRNLPDAQIKRFIQGLESAIERLKQAGKQVVFVHTVPLGALPRTCIARMPGTTPGHCNISRQTMLERENGYRSLVAGVLAKFGVDEFNPSEALCDDNKCVVFNKGEILYLDDSHLSRSGGAYLASISKDWFNSNLSELKR